MRRKDREVTDFETIVQIIDECQIIRIGLADGEFPYIVPLNFAYTVTGTDDLSIVSEYTGMSFNELMQVDSITFKILLRDGFIHRMRQT